MLERIAGAVATQLVIEFPDAEWAALVELAVARLIEALPPEARTSNQAVLRRVAETALKAAGAVK